LKQSLLKILVVFLLICTLESCAQEMPSPDGNSPSSPNVSSKVDEIDISKYQLSAVYQHSYYFRNIPGALLVANQDHGAALYYVNKSSGDERIYCFDALCKHTNCVARTLYQPRLLQYHPYDKNLYGIPPEHGKKGGSRLYCIDGETQEMRCAWEGNGNVIDTDYLCVSGQYLYFPVKRTEVGYDIVRYDVEKGKAEVMTPPDGKYFHYVMYISGDVFLVTFVDEANCYLTDEDFQKFTKTDYQNGFYYMNGSDAISILYDTRNGQHASVGFRYDNIKNGESYVVLEQQEPIHPTGFDGSYLYLIEYFWQDSGYLLGNMLYRISIDGGNVEFVYDFGGTLREVVSFEDSLFYYRKEYENGSPVHIYGKLTEKSDGFTAEDFEIIHP
jgi:hypothetical protein